MRAGTTLISFAWGFAEATLFFVVPDVPVGWVALRRPRSTPSSALAATAGAVVGALVLRTAVRRGWEPDDLFRSLPGVRAGDLERVRADVADDPARAFAVGSFSGMPVKLHVAEAARQGIPLARTVSLVVVNRAPRLGLFGLLLALAGDAGRRRGVGPRPAAGLYVVGWMAFYAWYWLAHRRRPTPER